MEIWKVGFAAMVLGLSILVAECGVTDVYSSRLVHRFASEVRKLMVSRNGEVGVAWPQHRSVEYYGKLMNSDLQRQKMKLGPQFQLLFPSQGSKTMPLGNDFGWFVYPFVICLFFQIKCFFWGKFDEFNFLRRSCDCC